MMNVSFRVFLLLRSLHLWRFFPVLIGLCLGGTRAGDAAQDQTLVPADWDAASAGDLKRMEEVADLALVPPQLNTSPLPEYDYDKLDYGMTIGIERTPGGRLWACWVAGGDSPKAFFVLATSDDDGESWSPPCLVVDSHSKALPVDRSVLVGNLWTDPLGRLWLIFDQSMDMFDGRGRRVGVGLRQSRRRRARAGREPRRIWHGVTLNKPTVLSTGEWMLPISLDQRGRAFGNSRDASRNSIPYAEPMSSSRPTRSNLATSRLRAVPESRLARAHDCRAEGRHAVDAGPHRARDHAEHLVRRRAEPGRSRPFRRSSIPWPGFTSDGSRLAASCWSSMEKRSTRMKDAACSPPGSRKMRGRRGKAD